MISAGTASDVRRPMSDPAPGRDEHPTSVVGQLVSTLICTPLALARDAQRHLPDVVQQTLSAGERAVHDYRVWLDRRLAETFPEAEAALRGLGLLPSSDGIAAPAHDEPASGADRAAVADAAALASPVHAQGGNGSTPAPTPRPVGPQLPVDDLAIPDYDSLSASQVVPRLVGLTVDELELVRRYEEAGRGRRTILSKIAQLQAG